MEEAQAKLKRLLEKAHKEKIDLWKIPAIQQQKNLLKVRRKFKLIVAFLFFLFFYGKFNYLMTSEKVQLRSFQNASD